MKYALIDDQNKVVNLIEYDGVTPYDPSPFLLELVPDHVNIGDAKDKPAPNPNP